MSVPDQSTIFYYTGNGITTTFAYGCYLLDADDLVVALDSVEQTSGFTVNGVGSQSGGAVIFSSPPADGVQVAIYRQIKLERLTDYQRNGDLPASTLNLDFDRLWMAIQDNSRDRGASIRYPLVENQDGTLPPKGDRLGMLLGFSAATGRHVMVPLPDSIGAGELTPFSLAAGTDFVAGDTQVTLPRAPGAPGNLQIHFDGVPQDFTQWDVSGVTVAFGDPIPVGVERIWGYIGTTLSIFAPSDDSVSDVKVQNPATAADGIKATKLAYQTGSLFRTVQDKLADIIHIKDYGAAIDGVTNDSSAIANARAQALLRGAMVFYGGKAFAPMSGTTPIAFETMLGSAAAYATGLSADAPLVSQRVFNATPQTSPGFAHYGTRLEYTTKSGVDVQSSVAFAAIVQSYSSNSGGTPTDNNTNQVAAVFNASAMDANSSASVTSVNVIGASLYTGSGTHTLNPFQVNIYPSRTPGWFGEAGKTYAAAATIVNVGPANATFALGIDTQTAGVGFLHGALISGVVNTGVTVARNTVSADTGVWVSAATTYGIYVGAKQLYQLNPGQIPAFDANHNPAVGIALGQRAEANGESNKLRFIGTNAGSVEQNIDLYSNSAGNLQLDFNGANRFTFSAAGALLQSGVQVLSGRQTGYAPFTGATNTGTTYDTTTVTLPQLAQRVAAMQASLTNHGLIGV